MIILCIAYLIMQIHSKSNKLYAYINFIYLLIFLSAQIIYSLDYQNELKLTSNNLELKSGLFFIVIMAITTWPLKRLRDPLLLVNKISVNKSFLVIFNSIYLFYLALFLYTNIIQQESFFLNIFNKAGEIRSDLDFSSDLRIGLNFFEKLESRLGIFLSKTSLLSLFLFFISFKDPEISALQKILFLIFSLIGSVDSLLIAGRTQIVYWLLDLGLFSYLFWKTYTGKKKYIFFLFLGVIFSLLISLNYIISFSRWDNNWLISNLLYFGQAPFYLNDFFINFHNDEVFLHRIIAILQFINPFSLAQYRDEIYSNSGMDIGIFNFFIGDLIVDLGFFGTIIFAIVMNAILNVTIVKLNRNITPRLLMVFLTILTLYLYGIFYYPFWRIDMVSGALFSIFISKYILKSKIGIR